MDDNPLIMPANQAPRLVKSLIVRTFSGDRIHDVIMALEEGELELRDDHILVVALVADQCPAWLRIVARQIRPIAPFGIEVFVLSEQ